MPAFAGMTGGGVRGVVRLIYRRWEAVVLWLCNNTVCEPGRLG
jgi:hypothetical protein